MSKHQNVFPHEAGEKTFRVRCLVVVNEQDAPERVRFVAFDRRHHS